MLEKVKEHISENIKQYIILFIILVFGVAVGAITLNNTAQAEKLEISEYLNTFVTDITESKINYFLILQTSIIKNIELILIIAFISLSVFGKIGIYVINGYKGFTLGYTISSFIAVFGINKGIITAMSLLAFSKLVYMPALLFLSVQSMKLYKALKENEDEKKVELIKYFFIIMIVGIALIISSLIETFINSNLLLLLLGGNK